MVRSVHTEIMHNESRENTRSSEKEMSPFFSLCDDVNWNQWIAIYPSRCHISHSIPCPIVYHRHEMITLDYAFTFDDFMVIWHKWFAVPIAVQMSILQSCSCITSLIARNKVEERDRETMTLHSCVKYRTKSLAQLWLWPRNEHKWLKCVNEWINEWRCQRLHLNSSFIDWKMGSSHWIEATTTPIQIEMRKRLRRGL